MRHQPTHTVEQLQGYLDKEVQDRTGIYNTYIQLVNSGHATAEQLEHALWDVEGVNQNIASFREEIVYLQEEAAGEAESLRQHSIDATGDDIDAEDAELDFMLEEQYSAAAIHVQKLRCSLARAHHELAQQGRLTVH